jgi:arylsulfatase A-like enzyme
MRFVWAVLWVVCTSAAALAAAGPASAAVGRPNIVWLSVEDMSPFLGCYGDNTVPTPNVDRLAREGIRYTNVFATTPVCAPSRHTIITGLYATQTGAMHMRNHSPSEASLESDAGSYAEIPSYEAVPPAGVRCFPEFLRMRGYYATNNPKEDYQFVAPPTAWDASSRQGHWRNRAPGQPFFAVFNCNDTHEGQLFPRAAKRPVAVKPEDVKLPPYYPDTPGVRQTVATCYNNVAAMDQWVGEKLAELEKAGLLDSTIIVFFSDHGTCLPRGKRFSYDSGLRVPLVVRFPDGQRAGTVDDRLISFLDFAPTVLSLAGIEPPDYMKGRPFLGAFTKPAPEFTFTTSDRMDASMDCTRSVGDGRFRYVRNYMPEKAYFAPVAYRDRIPMMKDLYALKAGGKAAPEQWQVVADHKPAEEFYDAKTDPHMVHNLIDAKEHAGRIDRMRQAMDDWLEETGDLGLIKPEKRMVKEKLWPPDGKQPQTATPQATLSTKDGHPTLALTCETPGASIGYRKKGEPAWRVYTTPVEIDPTSQYEVVAHRIGFKRSPIVKPDNAAN